MRKFLTTLFAASAIALPAAAATLPDGPAGDSPRGRGHARADADGEASRPDRSGERAGPSRGERSRPERPQASSPSAPAQAGPAEWSRHGMSDGSQRQRSGEAPTQWQRHDDAPTTRDRDGRRYGGWAAERRDSPRPAEGSVIHRDRPTGAFGSPTAHHEEGRQWQRTWRDNRRYDWRQYRESNRTVFRVGTYYDPYGTNYRRWNIGWSMRPYYYRSSFWINDPWRYRLPDVYGPYRWVRYYDDAILVNTWTGQVEDVIYNFFW